MAAEDWELFETLMYEIHLTAEAVEDIAGFRKFEQVRIIDSIESQLKHEPATETRNRKRLRPNALAEWAIRVDEFRVFYDVMLDAKQGNRRRPKARQ